MFCFYIYIEPARPLMDDSECLQDDTPDAMLQDPGYVNFRGILSKKDGNIVKGFEEPTKQPRNISKTRSTGRCECNCFHKILTSKDKLVQNAVDSAISTKIAKLLSVLISHTDQ
jgi:hypothetical protein